MVDDNGVEWTNGFVPRVEKCYVYIWVFNNNSFLDFKLNPRSGEWPT